MGRGIVPIWFFKKGFLDDYKKFAYEDGSVATKKMKYKEYIKDYIEDKVNENKNNYDLECYLSQVDFEECFPEIVGDITYPAYLDSKPFISFWHGFSTKNFTSASTLHFDRIHNIFVQVRGKKRILLFPPSNYLSFYPPLEDSSGIGHNSKVNPDILNLELFPKFPWEEKIEVVLQPGEMLYIPPFWWHHVTAVDENISLSFWYDVKIQDFFSQKNMLKVFLNIAPHYLYHAISSGESLMHTMNFFKGII
ncbi:cupin-like domain-containing protein [Nostoc sp. ChiQUE01b]|uniref:cupin-like domain-containing protein n=1 Tax=Nostoc sp. ChiQUE01b TaxID=3075376 RepID=UPI002AD5069F|nr:cupin-like domain-containing protein [Nostoc sp. ChiQUE01b]MDZ8262391.1 cupin-like domain-containing protein [Nostoc sp. ChiQUE01b]